MDDYLNLEPDLLYPEVGWIKVTPRNPTPQVPRPDKRGVLRELDRLLPLLPPIRERLFRFHEEIWNLEGYDNGTFPPGTMDRFDQEWEDLTVGIDNYNLDYAADGHFMRLTACRAKFESPDPAVYPRALNQFRLRASVDLRARLDPIVRLIKTMIAVIDEEVLPQRLSIAPERRDDISSWRAELADVLTIGEDALEVISQLGLAEEKLEGQSERFRTRWIGRRITRRRGVASDS